MGRVTGARGRAPLWAGMLAALLSLALLLPALAPAARAGGGVVLKVGYADSYGVTLDETGHSGYLVDYLEEIAKYTGWQYEYVRVSWGDGMDRLERGELDLMAMVHYTQERGERLLFSDLSMAHDYTALYAAADSGFHYQDYAAFDGCRVGVVAGTVFEGAFAAYARERGLDYELVPFPTGTEARQALLGGSIDLLATSGFSYNAEVKLVDRFQLERCYLVTGRDNQALMDQLNAAVQEARIHHPNLESDLMEANYDAYGPLTGLYLTREEQAYLDAAGPILVKGSTGRQPMGYTAEDGSYVGILPDFLDMLGELSGLEFVYEPAEAASLEENAPLMEEGDFALLHTDQSLDSIPLGAAIYKSDALFDTALAYVRRHEVYVSKADPHTFAVNSALAYVGDLVKETNEHSTVLYYDTSTECMEAVYDGRADMAILDEHVAAYLLQKPKFADSLVQVAGSTVYADSICLYVPEGHRPLIGILNKTLETLSQAQRLNTVANAMLDHAYSYQLDDFVYDHQSAIRVALTLLLVIIVLTVSLYARAVSLKKQERENEALQEQIYLDELTGVYNRPGFFKKAREMIDRGGDGLCIVRVNVCHFKVVNELCGPERGDRLLQEIGRGLTALSRQLGFVVGRFTGDHFYLCIRREDFERAGFARRTAAPWLGMDITTSYGVYPIEEQTGIPVSAMCDRADLAIPPTGQATPEYIHYYSDEARRRLLREQEIESMMEQAVAQRQFVIYVQPKYDVETEEIVGGEVLVRWKHPQKGMIPPGDFIGLFEKNGFILKLDYYVWEECCRFLAQAREKGLPSYPLSVNVSRIHFYSDELQSKLTGLLEKYGLEAGELELEITEGVCAEEPELIFKTCAELRRAGFKIAMDDFGSGYSSLNMLKEMPLDIIKMDLRFLSGEADQEQVEKGRNILRTLIELAHTLELQVVVEGLETEAQRDFIRKVGRCAAQGYFYSRPIDSQSYEALIG